MSTEAQIRANRENARRSTGPRTEEGKRRSSQNAIQHGFRSQAVILPSENQADFDGVLTALTDHFEPEDLVEIRLVRELAEAEWCIRRARRTVITMFEHDHRQMAASVMKTTSPEELEADVFSYVIRTGKLVYAQRYENSYERKWEKAYKEMTAYRKRKESEEKANQEPPKLLRSSKPSRQLPSATPNPLQPLATPPVPAVPARNSSAAAAKTPRRCSTQPPDRANKRRNSKSPSPTCLFASLIRTSPFRP